MEEDTHKIYQHIPHRPPFLWVDKILSLTADSIETSKYISNDLDIFEGHYPHYPLMPGVLLCEAVFQSGAILLSKGAKQDEHNTSLADIKMPVVTRIYKAKFKNQVKPGSHLHMHVTVEDSLDNAWVLKGKAVVEQKVAVTVTFGCMLLDAARV